jgi:integrase/recombinase XerD
MTEITLGSYQIAKLDNAGDYRMIANDTNDDRLVELWAIKPRRSKSANTVEQYRRQGKRFLADVGKPLQAIKYDDLTAWQNSLTGSINTQRLVVNAVKSLLSFAYESGYIRANPGVMLEPAQPEETKHRKLLSEADVIAIAHHKALSQRDRAIVMVLYSSGCRVSELCAMQWQDVIAVDGGKAEIVIRGKGGKTRESGISPAAYAAMLAIKSTTAQATDYIFTTYAGQIDRSTVNHLFDKLSKVIGKDISPHWLRHSHVSHALQRGGNAVDVQEQVGHSSLSVTTGYAHGTKHSSDYLVI